MTIAVEPPRDPLVPRPIDLPSSVPLAGPLDVLDGAKIVAAPDDPRRLAGLERGAPALARRGGRAIGYDGSAYDAPEFSWTRRCFAVALAWLWDELLYDHAAGTIHRRALSATTPSASSAGSTGSCSGTPIP